MEVTFQQGERENIPGKRNTQYVNWVKVLRTESAAGRDAGDAANVWGWTEPLQRYYPGIDPAEGRVCYRAIWQKAFQTQEVGPKRGNP